MLRKLLGGYVLYTALGLLGIYLVIRRSTSWEALLAGRVYFTFWGGSFAAAQLAAFALPAAQPLRFHLWMVFLSLFNVVVGGPLLWYAFALLSRV
jgi:hypothetical protein